MPRVGKQQRKQETEAERARRRPVVLGDGSAAVAVADRPVDIPGTTFDLAAELERLRASGGLNFSGGCGYKEDPLVWIREKHPKIESKTRGLVPFEPWPFQEAILRYVHQRKACVIEKSRQLGVSTTICIGAAHHLLYSHEVTGIPCHAHIIANKEETAMNLLRKVKTALWTAELSDDERDRLYGHNPGFDNPEVRHAGEHAQNYVRAHTSNESAGRSFDGNLVLLEEFAFLPVAQKIWTNIQPMVLDLPDPGVFVVSTHNGEGNFFCELVDHAAEKGLVHLPLDWRVHPHRDEAWKVRSQAAFEGSLAEWEQEFELRRVRAGEAFLDMGALQIAADAHRWLGTEPLSGHIYSKGIDCAGPGQDYTVHTVIDLTAQPAQVVYQKYWAQEPVLQKRDRIEALDQRYPGPLFIDGTNDPSLPALIRGRNVNAVRFSGGNVGSEKIDKAAGLRWKIVPRSEMRSWWISNLERQRVLVHGENFPELWEALATARYGDDPNREGGKVKRRGRNADAFDSAMLANLGMRKRERKRAGQTSNDLFAGMASSAQLSGLRRRW